MLDTTGSAVPGPASSLSQRPQADALMPTATSPADDIILSCGSLSCPPLPQLSEHLCTKGPETQRKKGVQPGSSRPEALPGVPAFMGCLRASRLYPPPPPITVRLQDDRSQHCWMGSFEGANAPVFPAVLIGVFPAPGTWLNGWRVTSLCH